MRAIGTFVSILVLACAAVAACSGDSPGEEGGLPLPERGDDAGSDTSTPNEDTGTPIIEAGSDATDDADGGDLLRVFVTSSTTNARMGGLNGADGICATLAGIAKLPGTYVAWLSVENGPHAVDRITSTGPWYLVTGELVASSKTELVTTGTLKHAIDRNEKGEAVAASRVWTGSGTNGRYLTNDCDKWTTGNDGRTGESDKTTSAWTSANVDDCDSQRRLYCFQR